MANCMMGFPNRIDAATITGGSWTAGLPLANLKDRRLGKVARSTNAALASTKFDMDLGKALPIKLVAPTNHNFSLNAKYRLRGSMASDMSAPVYDSGATFLDVWPVVYPFGTLEWEDDNWWSGKYTPEQIAGYTPTFAIILPTAKLARYWRLEIDDTANAAGYVQLGRVFIGPAWQPAINMVYGASLGWETKTTVQEARSGAEYFDARIPYQVERFTLDALDQDEAFSQAFELFRRAGIDKEVFFIHDPDDTVHALRRQFLARLRQLSAIEFANVNTNKAGFELKGLQ